MSTDSGEATPPPLPDALITPTPSGITKAEENTGPMNPTDCAMTSGSDRIFAPRRSYAGSELPIVSSFIVRAAVKRRRLVTRPARKPGEAAGRGGQQQAQPGIRSTRFALPAKI